MGGLIPTQVKSLSTRTRVRHCPHITSIKREQKYKYIKKKGIKVYEKIFFHTFVRPFSVRSFVVFFLFSISFLARPISLFRKRFSARNLCSSLCSLWTNLLFELEMQKFLRNFFSYLHTLYF